jgi:TetR/AcrR family transcriptional regulator
MSIAADTAASNQPAPTADSEIARPQRRPPGRPPAGGDGIAAETILSAALHAFATYGYEAVSLRTLSAQLGASHSVIGQRYGSKAALWHAAADYGFGRITGLLTAAFDPTIEEPLEQLRLWMQHFLEFSGDHGDLLSLVNIEGRTESPRLTYLFETYIAPAMAPTAALLEHLATEKRIRPISLRAFYFLVAHGGAASHSLLALAKQFDFRSPLDSEEVRDNARFISDLIIQGLRIPE